jgi:hypothetical protein
VQVRTKREESKSNSKLVPERYYSTKVDFVKRIPGICGEEKKEFSAGWG